MLTHVNTVAECPLRVHRLLPHPLRELGMQAVEDLCRLDPVDDAPDVIAVRVHSREAPVVCSSVMLLSPQNKRLTPIVENKEKRQTLEKR